MMRARRSLALLILVVPAALWSFGVWGQGADQATVRVAPRNRGAGNSNEAGFNGQLSDRRHAWNSEVGLIEPTTAQGAQGERPDGRIPQSLGPAIRQYGRARFDDGQPAAGVVLLLESSPIPRASGASYPDPLLTSTTRTSADGSFDVAAVRGHYWKLRIWHDSQFDWTFDGANADQFLDLTIPRSPTTLELEFVDAASGRPVSPVSLFLAREIRRWEQYTGDLTGTIRWSPAPAGRFRVIADFASHAFVRQFVSIEPGATTVERIQVYRGQLVRGVVVDDVTGLGVSGASIYVGSLRLGRHRSANTDRDGRFQMSRVPWDPRVERRLEIVAPGFAAESARIGNVAHDGAVEDVQIRLHRPAVWTARCVDSEGRPLADVVVCAGKRSRAEPSLEDSIEVTQTTPDDGRVALTVRPDREDLSISFWRNGAPCIDRIEPAFHPSERRDVGDVVVPTGDSEENRR